MNALDHIYLVFRKDSPSSFDRAALARYSGLTGREVEAVISSGPVTPAAVDAGHLNACRAVVFALEAGMSFETAVEAVGASSLTDEAYKNRIAAIAGMTETAGVSDGNEFNAAVEAIAAAARGCGMLPPRLLAA